MAQRIFLDTHILVWLYLNTPEKISSMGIKFIEECDLLYSPISILELQFLYEIKRLLVKPDKILSSLEKSIDLKKKDDRLDDIISFAMKIYWTKDPFDRLLMAHCQLTKCLFLTRDRNIRKNFNQAIW